MVQIEINEKEVEKTKRALAALLVNQPETRKRLQKIIRAELMEAVKLLRKDAKEIIKNDPRNAFLAVRSSTYRKILGGNLNILASRRAGQRAALITKPTLKPGQRGGNRRKMSVRTDNLTTYYGKDRGFILRFLDSGTEPRVINFTPNGNREKVNRGSQGGNLSKYGKTINTGSRGRLPKTNWFTNAAPMALKEMSARLEIIIDEELSEAFNEIMK